LEAAVEKRRQVTAVEEQIRDLQTLAELEEENSEEEVDSDEEDMRKIISKQHGDEDESMSEGSDAESGEAEDDDEEMESD